MVSFASKVRYGNAPRFDPMMEVRGGWIIGEAQRHDIEMEDAVTNMAYRSLEVNLNLSKNIVVRSFQQTWKEVSVVS